MFFGTSVPGPDARPAAVPKAAGATRPKRSASSKSGKGSKGGWDVGEPGQIPWQIPSMWVIFSEKNSRICWGVGWGGQTRTDDVNRKVFWYLDGPLLLYCVRWFGVWCYHVQLQLMFYSCLFPMKPFDCRNCRTFCTLLSTCHPKHCFGGKKQCPQ